MAAALTKKNEESVVLKFLWSRVAKHLKWVLLSFLFASVAAVVQVKTSQLVQGLMDEALIPKDWHKLLYFCALIVLIFLIDGVADFFHRLCLRIAAERTVRDMRREIFARFLVQSGEQNSQSTSSKALAYVLSDTNLVGTGLHVIADLLREPLILVALLGRLVYMNWQLTLICFVALPVVFGIGRLLGLSARRNQARIQRTVDSITNHITETMGGLRTAHSFGRTPLLREEFQGETDQAYRWLVRLARVEETVSPLTKWLTSWVGASLILLCGWLVVQGKMTPGSVLSYVTAAGLLQQPLRQLNQVNVRLQTVIASGRRIYDLLSAPLDAIGLAQSKILTSTAAKAKSVRHHASLPLEFRDVSYRYPVGEGESNRPFALQDIRLSLAPGRRLALVGKSGSGKSTFSLLAMRFLDPTRGQIILGDKPASQWDLEAYREHFGYVSQDVFLFNRSLRDNLKFARPDATDQQIWTALERASIKPFVELLPQGLDTPLGEHASKISGGERQRLAIARAFLRDAPILVLDEATSQLDSIAEKTVQVAMAELMEKRSVVLIAHRLATVREVDEVAVFESGRIVELGSPAALLENPHGHFSALWNAQRGGQEIG
ncbi:MAG: ABC transporter ATP-binding protein [Bdellovibrionales bacterium]|nr:ABC transporter ATP-binding protein [Bdellovibrionales bacterium]